MCSSSSIHALNEQIQSCLDNTDIDYADLKSLIEQREQTINQHLASLSPEQQKAFANSEIAYQKELEQRIASLFAENKKELSQSINARKLAAKYK